MKGSKSIGTFSIEFKHILLKIYVYTKMSLKYVNIPLCAQPEQ